MMFRPRHDEVLGHSDVEVGETRPMHRVAGTSFAAEGEIERTQRGTLIREELDGSGIWVSVNSLLYRLPVAVEHCRGVLREVDWECSGVGVEWEAGAISQDSGSGPAPEDGVHHAVGIPQQVMAMAD